MTHKIQLRRDTAAVWASVNPVLADGEMGIETDTRYLKFGDGITPWNELGYVQFPGAGTPPPVIVAPTNTALPTISGTAQVGSTLTAGNGTWSGSPTSYARQWLRDGVEISGATGSTYVPVTGDIGAVLSVRVTATNSAGSATATSAGTAAVTAAPADSRPRFGYGSATAGVDNPAALLASMEVMTGGTNGSKVGSFTSTVPTGQYGWAAFEASASASGVTFTDPLGTGGWQGASSPGNNTTDPGNSPNTSTVTATINGVTWRFFRQNYASASGQFTTS